MSTTQKTIAEIATDFAEGTELTAALSAQAAIGSTENPSRQPFVRRWLNLSDWARARELLEMDHALSAALAELRRVSDAADEHAAKTTAQSVQTDAFDLYMVECQSFNSMAELAHRLIVARALRTVAFDAILAAQEARGTYAEAKEAVALARCRSQNAVRHFAQLRHVRTRSTSLAILSTLASLAAAAAGLYLCGR